MTYLSEYVFRVKQDVSIKIFNMITNRSEPKTLVKHIITKHVNVSVKIIVHEKKIIVGILAHVFVKMASI